MNYNFSNLLKVHKSSKDKKAFEESFASIAGNNQKAPSIIPSFNKNPLFETKGFKFKKEDILGDIEGNLSIDLYRFLNEGKADPHKAFKVKLDPEAIMYIENFLKNKEALEKNKELYKQMLAERIDNEGLKEEIDRRVREGIREEWEKRVRANDNEYKDEADRALQEAIDENNNM